MPGKLYIVGTPIGNLEDITLRALRILKESDVIACEDTRTTKKLLSRYGIEKPLISYHEHNETTRAEEIAALLAEGKNVALVTDAGTPGISDPGYRAVKLASERGMEVLPIPGPSAAVAALSVSGLPTSGFLFLGFPPRTQKALGEFLTRVKDYPKRSFFTNHRTASGKRSAPCWIFLATGTSRSEGRLLSSTKRRSGVRSLKL